MVMALIHKQKTCVITGKKQLSPKSTLKSRLFTILLQLKVSDLVGQGVDYSESIKISRATLINRSKLSFIVKSNFENILDIALFLTREFRLVILRSLSNNKHIGSNWDN